MGRMRLGERRGRRAGRRRGRDPARHAAQAVQHRPRAARAAVLLRARLLARGHRPRWRPDVRCARCCSRAVLAAVVAAPARRGRRRQQRRSRDRDRRAEPGDVLQPVLQGARSVKHVRVITAWDSLRHKWSRDDLDDYMNAAHAAGVQVLLGFGHSRSAKRKVRRYVPRRQGVHQGVPEVQEALPVGEGLADLERGQPLRRADLPQGPPRRALLQQHQAQLLRLQRSSAADVLDTPDDVAVGQGVPAHGPQGQADLGPAQLHRREPLPHVGHEGAAEGRAAAGRSGSRRPAGWSCAATGRGSRSPATRSTRRRRPSRCSSSPR